MFVRFIPSKWGKVYNKYTVDEMNSELKEENMLQRKLQGRLVKKLKENTCITDYSQHGSHSQNNSYSSDFILNSLRNSMNPLH